HRLAKTLSDVTSIGYGLGRMGLGAVTGEEDAEAGDAAFELLELADVDDDRGEPEVGQVVRGARGGGGDQDAVAAERDDVAAGLLGDRPDGREEAGRDQLGQHQERAVRQGGHRGLQVQDAAQRDGDHGTAQRGQQGPQLADAPAVGPAAAADVHGAAGLEHVAAVQGAGGLDPGGAQAQRPDGFPGPGYLA